MDTKLVQGSLIVFIAVIFAFVATFGWFIIFKERVCKIDLNGASCFENYPTFLHDTLSHF